MKITPSDQIIKPDQTDRVEKKRQASGSFGMIFREQLAESPDAGTVEKSTLNPSLIHDLRGLMFNPDVVNEDPLLSRAEQFLDIMDEYSKKLGDPGITLKNIYPLVQKMESLKDSLAPMVESLPKGDKLKDILNQALAMSSVEIIKFNRGDYVDS